MAGTIARLIAAGVATGALAAVPGPAAAQEPPPGGGLSEQEERAVAQQQRFVDQQAEFFLAAAEAAQRRGDCAARASALASANVEIQTNKARAYVPPDVIESWEERVRAMEDSPCPPNDPLVEQRAIAIALALGGVELPGTGIGFQREGAPGETPETFAGETERSVALRRVEAQAELPMGVLLGLNYARGRGRTSFDVTPPAGGDAGAVYGAPAPSSSTGIAAPFPVSGDTRVRMESLGASVEIPFSRPRVQPGAARLTPFGFIEAGHRSVKYRMALSGGGSFGGGGFTFAYDQERRQKLTDRELGIGLGARFEAPLGAAGFGFFANARAGAYWQRSTLDSIERNANNFTGAPDDSFAIEIDEKESGIGFHGTLLAGVEIPLANGVAVRLGGYAEYRSRVGAVFNPSSGDQVLGGMTTGLRFRDAWSWAGVGGIVVTFP